MDTLGQQKTNIIKMLKIKLDHMPHTYVLSDKYKSLAVKGVASMWVVLGNQTNPLKINFDRVQRLMGLSLENIFMKICLVFF